MTNYPFTFDNKKYIFISFEDKHQQASKMIIWPGIDYFFIVLTL